MLKKNPLYSSLNLQNKCVACSEDPSTQSTGLHLQTVIYRLTVRDHWYSECLLNQNVDSPVFGGFKDSGRQKLQLGPHLVPVTVQAGTETG